MTIEEIYQSEDLSVRSFNVCNDNELKDLSAILEYFQKNKTFINLRNCGLMSNKELTVICLKYIDKNLYLENTALNLENQNFTEISNFTRTQREITNSFIEINLNNLSNRGKNVITSFLQGNVKIKNINEQILTNNRFNLQNLKNAGILTITELRSFIDTIKDFAKKVAKVENENDLITLKNRFFLEKTFSISSIPIEILESQSIFRIIDFLISKNTFFGENENIVFQKAFKIYKNQSESTLDEISNDLNLTRERVRQIRKICLEELINQFQFIKNIDDDLFQKYALDLNSDFINVDEDLSNFINEINNINFSNEFITFLISICLSDKFELIGNTEDVLQFKYSNSRNRHNWRNLYLVKRNIVNEFDFISFADDINNRLSERIDEAYSFNLKSYLINFIKTENISIISTVSSIVESIVNQEFNLIIDLNDNIIFKRNTVKQVPEYGIEALEKLGVPSKVEDIYNIIEKEYPGLTKSQEALRGSLQRMPEIICFGRTSTYGLKKWELEKEGIKGGTIRNIILEYLQNKDQPTHIYEIMNEVNKYRNDANAKSILGNLKLDTHTPIKIYNQSFVGLKNKEFQNNLTNLPKFLGKKITLFVKKNESIDINIVIKKFAKILEIDVLNMGYIIQQLIDNEFLKIDKNDKLSL